MSETAEALGSVQKTLLLPLWGRAVETRKAAPLLVDRTAAAVVDHLDYDFSRIAAHTHPLTRLAWIARALHIDRTLRDFLALRPRATVVNLGCGLDTTFERVDNGQLRWIDLDLPDVIELRQRLIAAGPRQRAIAGSALDPGWIAEAPSEDGLALVAAGLLYYFEEAQVRELLTRLAASCPAAELVFDCCSQRGARIANRKVIEDTGMDRTAVLRWGMDAPRRLAAWDRRIEVLDCYPMFRGITGRLPWRARPATLISNAMNIMSMVHLRFRP